MHSDIGISSSSNLKPVFEARKGFFASQHDVPFIFVSKSKRNLAGRQKAAGLNKELKEQAEKERSSGRQFEKEKKTLAEEEKKKRETRPEQVAEEENELEDLNLGRLASFFFPAWFWDGAKFDEMAN